ncbi:GNAT family N-acetyltransferase [Sinorhizobium meliloti]|uniref:GNAT family N-acetyltransferase n=1 Tax=Rhizobium meliloti TaxID=382 RepID=UPI002380891C|nr:GNAT family N-acetyltransferase [Sinorhizobium meliloti]MDE3816058.1 GNAT family N-acetyltransferase [Sinorhizobium meliloti]MDW9502141.1 GNAT family N-acetyltransferase [Sinorhizobium meliloti]MDW9614740.1 GNAT family N-acetyltransferase [Sinorhizobium meliloti]MDW9769698.1 GNAT family N-acetyltransferase [Sinorhizobium meliloti]MDW9837459.1 GNAT family N-acetyltransferase [Sinorhizobium meliloti]
MFDYRFFRPGDESAITKLFHTVFDKPMSPAAWNWRYLHHPAGAAKVMLAFCGDKLVGHYAANSAPLSVGGSEISAALSMTTMTHPDFRGRGLFEKTANKLYECLPELGVAAVFGFPNAAVHALRQIKVGWRDIYEVPTLKLDLRTVSKLRKADPAVVQVDHIDDRFDAFFRVVGTKLPVCGVRNAAVLTWRLDQNPENLYTRLVLSEGNEISGYAITKNFGVDTTDLVELRCADNATARALLSTVIARASSAGHTQVSTWCLPQEAHRLVLESVGFKAEAPITYFGGRTFQPISSDLFDSRLWRLSMLDSDLY